MYDALVARDPTYEGVFVVGVHTTGIFCRATCPARKPRRENVSFFSSVNDALHAGFRPCKRCRPLEPPGGPPAWLRPLLEEVEKDPTRRLTDDDLRTLGVEPSRVRRWFRASHGMTFHTHSRARRLGLALGCLERGGDLTDTAHGHGYSSLSGFREAFQKVFQLPPGRGRRVAKLAIGRLVTPLGPAIVGTVAAGVALFEFADRRALERQVRAVAARLDAQPVPGWGDHAERLGEQLAEYFAGNRVSFDVPLVVRGTEFQRAVWNALLDIPYGETRSYRDVAAAIGRPRAVRAVGRANGENPLAILVPCHRVVGHDGSLTGYGGGLRRKEHLLRLEGATD